MDDYHRHIRGGSTELFFNTSVFSFTLEFCSVLSSAVSVSRQRKTV